MDDEQAIRALFDEWGRASMAGDWEKLRGMMAEDVVFLVAGQPPMRGRDSFAARFKAVTGQFQLNVVSDIQEIRITGEWAYTWNFLRVTMTPRDGGPAMKRSGNVLTIFRKEAGRWLLARDANLLTPEEG